jgi:hypothetical protein
MFHCDCSRCFEVGHQAPADFIGRRQRLRQEFTADALSRCRPDYVSSLLTRRTVTTASCFALLGAPAVIFADGDAAGMIAAR